MSFKMHSGMRSSLLVAVAIGLMSASLVGFNKLPAFSSAQPNYRHEINCNSTKPCLQYTNYGTGAGLKGYSMAPNGDNGIAGHAMNPHVAGTYGINFNGGF